MIKPKYGVCAYKNCPYLAINKYCSFHDACINDGMITYLTHDEWVMANTVWDREENPSWAGIRDIYYVYEEITPDVYEMIRHEDLLPPELNRE